MIELLSPAGDLAMLRAALDCGADSVYFGVKGLNMRAAAKNFEVSQLRDVARRCHDAKAMAYLVINTIIYEDELQKLDRAVKEAKDAGIDAIICWDFSVIEACRRHKMEFHISTQASVSNSRSAKMFTEFGAGRIVLARECTLEHIKEIHNALPDLEIECFVHGAMCVSISGRCFISHSLFGKSANRGECAQPCRREYKVTDNITGKELSLEDHHVMSAKDLCAIGFLDRLLDAGISVFKIEGRNRSPEYVSYVTSAYRKAIDALDAGNYTQELIRELEADLSKVYNREFSRGFYFGMPIDSFTGSRFGEATHKKIYVGRIAKVYNKINVMELDVTAHEVSVGENLMVQGKHTGSREFVVEEIRDMDDKQIQKKKRGIALIKAPFRPKENEKVFIYRPIDAP